MASKVVVIVLLASLVVFTEPSYAVVEIVVKLVEPIVVLFVVVSLKVGLDVVELL